MASMTRKGQVYSVGNYLMTGKVFGKGHFARVEEATHRIIGRKVAIKIIDLTLIKEEYARRNLHREPRVMAKLKHPCIAALYETMMHGPRLYVVMEAAGGGDLCAHVLAHGARARLPHAPHGLPEPRARSLATQLVSAVRHMHARGVVHRDLKMENIMLDTTKQFIKIVDFGLSNMWSGGAALRTPCGSLEYAAPELFVDGLRYGPEVDLWSVGVIVYGMVLGALPFTGGEREAGGERAQLRAAIARGLTRRQRAALQATSPDCKAFIQQLLEPNVELRMKIEEAARHRWVKRPGLKMKVHPLPPLEPKLNREVFKQISELTGQPVMEVISSVKAEPFGPSGGMYNIKCHVAQLASAAAGELLWSASGVEARPESPPRYAAPAAPCSSKHLPAAPPKPPPRFTQTSGASAARKYRMYENGDCADSRLPCIDEHEHADFSDARRATRIRNPRSPRVRRALDAEPVRLHSCPARAAPARRDPAPSWRGAGASSPAPRVLLHTHATTIKRASLGNIASPHSSSNSHCKSERAMPVGWFPAKPAAAQDAAHLRLRRTAPMK